MKLINNIKNHCMDWNFSSGKKIYGETHAINAIYVKIYLRQQKIKPLKIRKT